MFHLGLMSARWAVVEGCSGCVGRWLRLWWRQKKNSNEGTNVNDDASSPAMVERNNQPNEVGTKGCNNEMHCKDTT